jgi:hypothetical protein
MYIHMHVCIISLEVCMYIHNICNYRQGRAHRDDGEHFMTT